MCPERMTSVVKQSFMFALNAQDQLSCEQSSALHSVLCQLVVGASVTMKQGQTGSDAHVEHFTIIL